MVKVLRSFVRGPLEPHVAGFAEELLRQGYSRSSAAQHVCFIAHLDRWMSAEGVELDGLSASVIERYLAERRAAGYVEYRSVRALRPLLEFLAPLGVLPVPQSGSAGPGGGTAWPLPRLLDRRARPDFWDGARLRGLRSAVRRHPPARRGARLGRLDRSRCHRVRAGRMPGAGGWVGEADRLRVAVAAGLAACRPA